jgi:hypothetical protein
VASQRDAARALERSRTVGHVWIELATLDWLLRHGSDAAATARRDALLDDVASHLADPAAKARLRAARASTTAS